MHLSVLFSILAALSSAHAIYVSEYKYQPVDCPIGKYSVPVDSSSTSSDASTTTSSESSSTSTVQSSSVAAPSSSSPVPTQLPLFNSCPNDLPLSCSTGATDVDSCCVETPGGVLLQTQFWDYDPATGPKNEWTIHGLWPDNCDGTYGQYCDDSMNVDSVRAVLEQFGETELLDYMNTNWKDYQGQDDSLWTHEYNKHATCMSTIKPNCFNQETYQPNENMVEFFKQVVSMYKALPSYQWLSEAGINPSNDVTYAKSDISAALNSQFGAEVYFGCDKNGALDEIWYYYHLQGHVIDGDYIPIDFIGSNNCPDQIKYPVKGAPSSASSTSSGSSNSTATSAPTINGTLSPVGQTGCLISDGSWFTSGTCATYHLETAPFGGYNLKSSKGYCNFEGGDFTCSSTETATQFDIDSNNLLTFGGIAQWSADHVPAANEKVKVESGSTEAIKFNLKFQKA